MSQTRDSEYAGDALQSCSTFENLKTMDFKSPHSSKQRPWVLSIYVQPSVASVDLPDITFTCSSLEEMELQIDSRWHLVLEPVLVDLPRLRRLNLSYYTIKGDFMNGLLLSCQTAGIVLENMSSLVKACVCFLTDDEFERAFYNSEAKILNGLSGVSNLDVVLHGLEAEGMLGHALMNCPDFENLKVVHFESFDGYPFGCVDMINCFVHHSPISEDLAITIARKVIL